MNLPKIKRRNTVLRTNAIFKPVDNHQNCSMEDDLDSTHLMYINKTKDFISAGNILKRYGARHKVTEKSRLVTSSKYSLIYFIYSREKIDFQDD